MGSLALLARECGYTVRGCDANIYPPMSHALQSAGITIDAGYEAAHLAGHSGLVIVGNAVTRDNSMMRFVMNERLPYTSGPAWIAAHVLANRQVIAIAGTHGKTTTTAMVIHLLKSAGLNPGYLIGGVANGLSAHATVGDCHAPFVIEADEYDTAFFDKRPKFLHYRPSILLLNNLEFDHADIYDNLAAIQTQCSLLLRTVPDNGLVVVPAEDDNVQAVMASGCWSAQYAWGVEEGDVPYRIVDVGHGAFEAQLPGEKWAPFQVNACGEHTIKNMLSALIACQHVGVALPALQQAAATFLGVKRRLEVIYQQAGVTVYDDFAHHPTAIATTLSGLRSRVGTDTIIAIVQCASYTMQKGIHKDVLATALAEADNVLCLRPDPDWGIDVVTAALSTASVCESVDEILAQLPALIKPPTHVLIMSNRGFDGIYQRIPEALGVCENLH